MSKENVFLFLFLLLWINAVKSYVHHHRSTTTQNHMHHKIVEVIQSHDHEFTPIISRKSPHKDSCSDDAVCVLLVQCPAHFYNPHLEPCTAIGERQGVCCTTGQNHTGSMHESARGHQAVRIDSATLGALTRHSRVEVAELHMREAQLLNSGHSALHPGAASYSHFRNSRLFSLLERTDVISTAGRALEMAIATRTFKHRQGISNKQLEMGMIRQNLMHSPLGGACTHMPSCSSVAHRYTHIDGSCNNLRNPSWGAAHTPYSRLLPPNYHDGVWIPRVSKNHGQQLNSPRLISTTIFSDYDIPNENYTLMVMQFGQYLAHEITQSIDTSFANGSAISCCTSDGSNELPHHFRHYACMPILIPQHDNFYGEFQQGCMNFVRSLLAPRHDCTLGYAQQMNKVSHFIDGSSIYGSSVEQTNELRSFKGGQLRVFHDFGRDLLPLSKDPEACLTMEQGSACFESGDTRTNQMISLVVIHTIFLREHNRIAKELEQLNPHWSDDTIFMETRRILAAEIQVITYKEYLPTILGDDTMKAFQIFLNGDIYSYDYNPHVDPSITNEFATAAWRFGHSTVDGLMKVYGATKMEEVISIPEIMFHPARLRKKQFLDEILSTLTTEPIQQVDNSISDAMTRYMFRAGSPFGVDIASLNIQRGRDHGLRAYNDYRVLTGLQRINSFEEFGPELGEKLASVYASVDDVDLWVGGLLEAKAPNSILGPTFRDIIADQFFRLKNGDKYFFNHDPSVNSGYFTKDQIKELKKTTMARLVCDNSDGILLARQAPNAFRKPGVRGNEFVDCSSPVIPHLNLIHWKEHK